jgi:nucleotide-binding universal stress UspA family protein
MNRIIVGFDGSEGGRDALRLGAILAFAEGAELEVAVALSYTPLPIQAIDPDADERALAEQFDELFADAERQLSGVDFVRRELRHPSAAEALHELAEAEDAEVIVVGSTHRGELGRVYPGSVGERLLGGAPCAVAVAPRGFAQREPRGLGVVGVAYDGTEESKLALTAANHVAGEFGASLKLIAVVPHLHPMPARIGHTTVGYSDALRRHFRDVLDQGAAEVALGLDAETVLEEGEPAATLASLGSDLDLLFVGSRGYGPLRRVLLGGVSAELMRIAPCPVVVTPRGTAPLESG